MVYCLDVCLLSGKSKKFKCSKSSWVIFIETVQDIQFFLVKLSQHFPFEFEKQQKNA
jgi:hypothetical protein